jgi:glycerol-3-phosphate acyltransferase PlsY
MTHTQIIWIAGSYLLGSIPTGYWLGMAWKGVDVRKQGSGNLGATNVFRVLGPGPGIVTLVLDMLKGFLPVLACLHFFPGDETLAIVVGLAAIIGHITSFFVGFRGGKGVATSAGVFSALLPIPALFALIAFGVSLALSRIVSLSSLIGASALAISSFWLAPSRWMSGAATGVAVFIFWTHRGNIRRLIQGSEPRIQRAASQPSVGRM